MLSKFHVLFSVQLGQHLKVAAWFWTLKKFENWLKIRTNAYFSKHVLQSLGLLEKGNKWSNTFLSIWTTILNLLNQLLQKYCHNTKKNYLEILGMSLTGNIPCCFVNPLYYIWGIIPFSVNHVSELGFA
jgi:hypothetical protein